jgi:PPOX class probable F420-dependent enzyme
VEPGAARERFAAARSARLASIGPDGPHLVPVCFAVVGDTVYSAIDAKPKRGTRLQRLRNLEADPRAAMLADHYEDRDWSAL